MELLVSGEINEQFQMCTQDSDCVSVKSYRCDTCSCGIYINKEFESKYSDAVQKRCESSRPSDKVCLPRCAVTVPVCVNNKCGARIQPEMNN